MTTPPFLSTSAVFAVSNLTHLHYPTLPGVLLPSSTISGQLRFKNPACWTDWKHIRSKGKEWFALNPQHKKWCSSLQFVVAFCWIWWESCHRSQIPEHCARLLTVMLFESTFCKYPNIPLNHFFVDQKEPFTQSKNQTKRELHLAVRAPQWMTKTINPSLHCFLNGKPICRLSADERHAPMRRGDPVNGRSRLGVTRTRMIFYQNIHFLGMNKNVRSMIL